MGGRHDGISGDVELDIISIGMEQETMLMEDVTEYGPPSVSTHQIHL